MALINESQFQYYNNLGQDFGSYQFVPLSEIIDAFMFIYVGEDKIISKVNRADVFFHAQRALQELSFDTLKSFSATSFSSFSLKLYWSFYTKQSACPLHQQF